MAILLDEPQADACAQILEQEGRILICAGTLTETLIVAGRREVGAEARRLLDGLNFEIVALTSSRAMRAADAYKKWGEGVHPASLNFGDCFAYALSSEQACPLLFVGEDFTQTDAASAL